MTSNVDKRIAQLEILVSEQEYLIQTLNDVISRQDKSISRIETNMTKMNQQFGEIKSMLPDEISTTLSEVPPHY